MTRERQLEEALKQALDLLSISAPNMLMLNMYGMKDTEYYEQLHQLQDDCSYNQDNEEEE